MNLYRSDVTREQVADCISKTRAMFETFPASKSVLKIHDILSRFESSYADGKEPEQDELKGYFGEISDVLENL